MELSEVVMRWNIMDMMKLALILLGVLTWMNRVEIAKEKVRMPAAMQAGIR